MNMQSLPTYQEGMTAVAQLRKSYKRGDVILFIVIFGTVLSLTPLLVLEGLTIGVSLLLGTVAAVAIAVAIMCWPIMGLFGVLGAAVLIEQQPIVPAPPITNYLYVFYWPPRLAGLIERPIGFLMLLVLFVFICHRFTSRKKGLQGGALFGPFLFYLLCILFGVAHGLTSGGNLKIVVVEIRPFWYMFLSYILAYNLITRKEQIKTFFWIVIIGAGVKALQGVYIYAVVLHGDLTGHREIMAHEESFFFVALILLIVLFSLHYRYRAQLYTSLCILPFLLVALVANQRRTDYIALLVALGVAWMLIFLVKPKARKKLFTIMLISVTLGTAYVLAFQHTSGSFGAPARSIISIFHPDPTDASSNLYRTIEDFDLKFTVKQNPLGLGFGKPFLQPIPLPNILIEDPYYLYVPHNTVYWIWMRLGWIGYFALWFLIGSFIIRGTVTARNLKDPYLQLVAIYIVAVTFMEVIVAFADYQFFFYRNVIYLGLLMGIMMKLPALDAQGKDEKVKGEKGKTQIHEAVNSVPQPATAGVGR